MKEMRLAGIDSLEGANHTFEMRFPEWEQRFTVAPRNARNAASTKLGREEHLDKKS